MTEILTCDIECYPNYFLVVFKRLSDSKFVYLEKFEDSILDTAKLLRILRNNTIVTFNGNSYDIPMLSLAIAGLSNIELKRFSDNLIQGTVKPWKISNDYTYLRHIDTIDLIDVAPLKATLKIYGGRLHTHTMQDLPLEPDTIIKDDQRSTIVSYCMNDVTITGELYEELKYHIELRSMMSERYGIDLRSKGDAKIAETIIMHGIAETGNSIPDISIAPGTKYKYIAPEYIKFESKELNDILQIYSTGNFTVQDSGHILFDAFKSYKYRLGITEYTLGIGGIHSNEKSVAYYETDVMEICDCDVTSYYPNIILNNKYYPTQLGQSFYQVYKSIVTERIEAKRQGDKLKATALKIPINASFGKFGSKYSKLYAPNLVVSVTITGQLSLLMLIEKLEQNGISVISANTDGIVCFYPREKRGLRQKLISEWSTATGYLMEETYYCILASRDVNNYIAVKLDGTIKGKGAYADLCDEYYHLRNNPDGAIAYEAARQYLAHDIPIAETINSCTDIRQFVSIRTVTGGAVYAGNLIGKSIRYYHSSTSFECFFYSDKVKTTAGHKVPDTDDTVPCMILPDKLPNDIDYDWYIHKAEKVLMELGVQIL